MIFFGVFVLAGHCDEEVDGFFDFACEEDFGK